MVALVVLGRCDHSQPVANPAMQTVRVCVSLCVCVPHDWQNMPRMLTQLPPPYIAQPVQQFMHHAKAAAAAAKAEADVELLRCCRRIVCRFPLSVCQKVFHLPNKNLVKPTMEYLPSMPPTPNPPLSPTTPRQTNITKLVSHRCLGYCTLHQLPFD